MRFSSRVGARIRYYRNLNKISLQTLAQSIHKSISTVSKYESGQIAIDIDRIIMKDVPLKTQIKQSHDTFICPHYR